MTTIAYRAGIMAADSGAWLSNVAYRTANKLAVGPDGSLHGVTGGQGECETYLQWVRGGMAGEAPKPEPAGDAGDNRSSFLALVISPAGDLSVWTAHGHELHGRPEFFALGAGSEMAIGALAAGATAEEAVAIVAEHSEYARTPVRTISRSVP